MARVDASAAALGQRLPVGRHGSRGRALAGDSLYTQEVGVARTPCILDSEGGSGLEEGQAAVSDL